MFKWATDPRTFIYCGIVLGALVLLSVLMAFLAWRRYRFIDGMVHGVIGRMGSGKSLYVTQRVLVPVAKQLRNGRTFKSSTGRPVRRIITLTGFRSPYKGVDVHVLRPNPEETIWGALRRLSYEWAQPADMTECDRDRDGRCVYHDFERDGVCWDQRLDALIWIDEAHDSATSDKQRMEEDARWVTSRIRKLNAELWWASQSEMKVHKRLRDDSTYVWRVNRYRGVGVLIAGTSWFRAAAYDPAMLTRADPGKPIDVRWYRLSRRALRRYNSFQVLQQSTPANVRHLHEVRA